MPEIVRGEIRKVDAEKRLVFGWAYVAVTKDGSTVEDHSGDVLELDGFEDVVYEYVLESRDGGEMHVAKGVSRLVESVVFTPEKVGKMGLPEGSVPMGWWVGFRVDDDGVWDRVQKGELTMFSIGGIGEREPIEEELAA